MKLMRYPKTVADGLMYDADLYEHTENNDNYINYTYIIQIQNELALSVFSSGGGSND